MKEVVIPAEAGIRDGPGFPPLRERRSPSGVVVKKGGRAS